MVSSTRPRWDFRNRSANPCFPGRLAEPPSAMMVEEMTETCFQMVGRTMIWCRVDAGRGVANR